MGGTSKNPYWTRVQFVGKKQILISKEQKRIVQLLVLNAVLLDSSISGVGLKYIWYSLGARDSNHSPHG